MGEWFVYLICCADATLYCGVTNDLARRLGAHGRGRVKYTRGRLPVALAHVERASDRSAALRAEAAWKRLSRAQKLRRIADGVRASTCLAVENGLSADHALRLLGLDPRRRGRVRR